MNLCLAPFLSDFYLTWTFIPGSVFRIPYLRFKSCPSAILHSSYPPYCFFLDKVTAKLLGICLLFTHIFFHPSADEYVQYFPGPILRKNVSLCPTIFSTYFLFFTLFLHCPRFCHCSLNILALFSNYLSLINSLYLVSSLINFLKFIMIKNVIPFTNYMSCFLLLCLSISFLQIHLKFFLKLSCPAFYESDFSEYLKWLLPLHFFCLIANFVFAPHNHFISICKHSSFMTLDFFPCSLPWIISSTTIFYCRTWTLLE